MIPDNLDETGEVFSGGSVEGNICIPVESAQLDGAMWMVEELLSFEDERIFVAFD